MRYVIEFINSSLVDKSDPQDVARALGKILDKDLRYYWGTGVTVTPEGNLES
jgi:hypothetical protein